MQRSPIRGEDAANAAGEGTADGARSVPSFLRRQESIRRASATTGRKLRLHGSPGASSFPPLYRHSRVGENLAPIRAPQRRIPSPYKRPLHNSVSAGNSSSISLNARSELRRPGSVAGSYAKVSYKGRGCCGRGASPVSPYPTSSFPRKRELPNEPPPRRALDLPPRAAYACAMRKRTADAAALFDCNRTDALYQVGDNPPGEE